MEEEYGVDQDLGGFDVACIDEMRRNPNSHSTGVETEVPSVPLWTEVVSRKNRKTANLCKLLDCCPVEIASDHQKRVSAQARSP